MFKHIRTTIADLMAAAHAAKDVLYDTVNVETGEILVPEKLQRYRVGPEYFTSTNYLKQHDRADWQGSRPDLQIVIGRAMERMRRMGFPMYVHTVYRSPVLQAQLKAKGFSQIASGAHQRSEAADVVHAHFHWECSEQFWALWGRCVKEASMQEGIPVVWGGDWAFYDPAHVELTDWRNYEPHDPGEPLRTTPRAILRNYGIKVTLSNGDAIRLTGDL